MLSHSESELLRYDRVLGASVETRLCVPAPPHQLIMDIFLLRCGNRSLILPRTHNPAECPLLLRLWLGLPYSQVCAQTSDESLLPRISARAALEEISVTGYCAVDGKGRVRTFLGLGSNSHPQ